MGLTGEQALSLAKKYAKDTMAGAGAIKGDTGKSAYQSALDTGFEGTEAAWIASLKGERGDTGEQGPQGERGTDGTVSFDQLTDAQKASLKGESGKTYRPVVGKVTSVSSSSSPSVNINVDDDAQTVSFSFNIPKGETGGNGYVTAGRKGGTTNGTRSTAEGYETTASNSDAHAEGTRTVAKGSASHAEGTDTTASGSSSHAEGNSNTASGTYSHAEGYKTTASGEGSHAEGFMTTANGRYSHAGCYGAYTNDYQYAIGSYNEKKSGSSGATTSTVFIIGNGSNESTRSNAFRVQGDGKTYAKGSYSSTGADYAEFFEWADGNLDAEDRRGYFVTFDEQRPYMIRKANSDEYILGVISGNPCVVGNSDESWLGRYITDDFGAFIYEDVEVEEVYIDDETGEQATRLITTQFYKQNPDYDPKREYIPRIERPEWDYVGMMGVLYVWDDGSCIPGGYCTVADGGIATASERKAGAYRVIQRVNDNVVKIVFTISY